MSDFSSRLAWLDDPRLAVHATSATPMWLFSADGSRVLWANPAAAAILGSRALSDISLDPDSAAASDIARLAETLRPGAPPRLERLRGFGGPLGGALMCACSRLADDTAAIQALATEPATPGLSLEQRVERLFADCEEPIALFAPGGALLHATPAGVAALHGLKSLTALGVPKLAATALADGEAGGPSNVGEIAIRRVGADAATVLMVGFAAPAQSARPAAAAPPEPPKEPTPIAPPAAAPIAAATPAPAPPAPAERRKPLRFVWKMDVDGRFSINSDEFTALIGPQTTATLGRPWHEAAAALGLDDDQQIARALESRQTWSGIEIHLPVDGGRRLTVELSGLPVFDRERSFHGYRGFGVCRDVAGVTELEQARRGVGAKPAAPRAEPPALRIEPPALRTEPAAPRDETRAHTASPENVVPFRGPAPDEKAAESDSVEHSAFRELANRLMSARLRVDRDALPADDLDTVEAEPASLAPASPPDAAAPQTAPASPPETAADVRTADQRSVLDRLPVGVLVYRLNRLIYANRAFLEWTGYGKLDELEQAGGLETLFIESNDKAPLENGAKPLSIVTAQGDQTPIEARLFTAPWDGESAMVLMFAQPGTLRRSDNAQPNVPVRRETERETFAKSEFLAKISHELRTPLNTIIGFVEVMKEERFGPLGNERYKQYLNDIHASAEQVGSMLAELLDLSKIEAGKLDLDFTSFDLNDLTQQCVGVMQPQAHRERVIIRTSLAQRLPPVVADNGSVRQMILNLLSNSIKFTRAGGQIIVSTAASDNGGVLLRVRDTGVGMSEKEIAIALEPFRQLATSARWGSGGTGLALPLTKALAEANRATFSIKSAVNAGTLVEVAFPGAQLAAE